MTNDKNHQIDPDEFPFADLLGLKSKKQKNPLTEEEKLGKALLDMLKKEKR